jgi:hypothetical protein
VTHGVTQGEARAGRRQRHGQGLEVAQDGASGHAGARRGSVQVARRAQQATVENTNQLVG